MCSNTMDKIGKEIYADPTHVYKFRDTVDVPPLEMVDDIFSASKCGPTTVALNAAVNSFVEGEKITLSSDKCARIHIGSKAKGHECPTVKVHNENMNISEKEKYLGEFVTKKCKCK